MNIFTQRSLLPVLCKAQTALAGVTWYRPAHTFLGARDIILLCHCPWKLTLRGSDPGGINTTSRTVCQKCTPTPASSGRHHAGHSNHNRHKPCRTAFIKKRSTSLSPFLAQMPNLHEERIAKIPIFWSHPLVLPGRTLCSKPVFSCRSTLEC